MKFTKKFTMLLFPVTFILLFSSCANRAGDIVELTKEQTVYEKIHNELINLQTYKSEATVEYISNKGKNVYDTLQQCKVSGQYRVEVIGPENVIGNVTLSDGSTIYQFNPRISAKVSVGVQENQERSEIFITSFIKNYMQSQEVSISVGNFGEGKCTVLEAQIPGNHPYLVSEKLWVDNKSLKPLKLSIYDPDGTERIIVTYNTFEYNVELDDSLFTYTAMALNQQSHQEKKAG